ncbi:MAG TPA: hypothetical protein PK794_07190, partial [Armatimonadota bacterium]|nr:hypothetical protein [Armatimonadota bacterium]
MEFTLWRVWLPCSLALHLLLLPVLARVRLPAPPEPAEDALIIVPIADVPERLPPPPTPPRAAARPPLAVKPKSAPRKVVPAPATPPRAAEATVAMKAAGVSDLSGLRHGMGGG